MNLKILTILLLTLVFTSCSTLFTGTKQNVQINTVPSGAKVLVNGIDRGTTPSSISLKKSSNGQVVTLKKDGYETRTISPETTFNSTSILNLFNLLFWGIDAATGAMHKYDPSFYEIELEKK